MSVSPHRAEALLSRLEWSVIRRLDGLLQGDYRTLFRGFGLDFADLREYQAYDDVRHIDWNVTARTQTPYVRVYNEDRDVTAWFVLDLSPSVEFGSTDVSKRDVLVAFTAVVSRLLVRQGNRVGAILFDGRRDVVVPPGAGRRHVLNLIERILSLPRLLRSPPTDLAALLGRVQAIIRRRALVFVVSDFISSPGWSRPLLRLQQRNETLAVRLTDPMDLGLPAIGMMAFEDAESGEQVFVDTGDPRFRRRFAAAAEARETDLLEAFARAGIDVLELSTEDDLVDAILRFADLRRASLRGGAGTAARLGWQSAPGSARPREPEGLS